MEIPYVSTPRKDTGLYNAKVGIWLFLASEVMLFGALFSSYILLRVGAPEGTWPLEMLSVPLGMINTLVLIVSSVTVVMAWASLKMNNFRLYRIFQAVTLICALTFMVIKSFEYYDKFTHYEARLTDGRVIDGHRTEHTDEYIILSHANIYPTENDALLERGKPKSDRKLVTHSDQEKIALSDVRKLTNWGPWHSTYLAIYFTLTGLHALHVLGGAFVIFMIWGPLAKMWKTDPVRYTNRVEVSGLFWHFVDLVWIFLFPVLYLL